jgi:UDP-N-acetyl-D-galactosamine dehydrogenase
MILAGRRLNDSMGEYIAEEVIKLMIKKDINIKNSNILVLGATFKENCPDVRNTRVVDILNCLATYHTNVTVMDPWVNPDEMHHEYGWRSIKSLDESMRYDAVVLAVAHNEFREINLDTICKKDSVIYDVKGFFPLGRVDQRL